GRAMLRRMWHSAATPRRTVMFILGLVIMLLWMGVGGIYVSQHAPPCDPQGIQMIAPLALLAICMLTVVSSVGDRAIAFTPGEVALLFAAPFTRRQLIAYKLTKSPLGALLTALFLSYALRRHAVWWPARYVGVFL